MTDAPLDRPDAHPPPRLVMRATTVDDEAKLLADGYVLGPHSPPGGPRHYVREDESGEEVDMVIIFEYQGPWTFP